ncbi:MAG: L,D-transpeptidase [Ruminococcaceae bacterium]|nr:L,D-transpeptidase [Oscillospiraceae bacterium]
MKKYHLMLLIAAVAGLVTAGLIIGVWANRTAKDAEAAHAAVYASYEELLAAAEAAELPVSEQGVLVGSYSLDDLGLGQAARDAVEQLYTASERMTPEEFRALSLREKRLWNEEKHAIEREAELPIQSLDTSAVLADLGMMERKAAENAYMSYESGVYRVHDEELGNVLREDVVTASLREAVDGLVLSGEMAALPSLEITDHDCYVLPEVTVENGGFNPGGALYEAIDGMEITVQFHTGTEVLTAEELRRLVSLDPSGAVVVDEAALEALLGDWAAVYNRYDTPYLFDSYAGGVVPIEFLSCQYEVRTPDLREMIRDMLLNQQGGEIAAPYACYDKNWEAFAIRDTYVEVDIHNQQITYYKDGKLIVNSDIVTGRVMANWDTPEGLYSSYDRQTDRWLIGEDYAVFVKYWVRIWNAYGLHDASWRTIFGGDQYIRNGSHGCVNIPEAAMEKIYANIEDGTPVLVFDYHPDEAE